MTLHPVEWIIPAAYLLILAGIGFLRKPDSGDETDFLLGGRRLTLPAFVATLVTTWYGGILGVGEFTWRYGIANWLVFGVPYYLFAVIYALVLAPKIRRSGGLTIPDRIASLAGPTAGRLAAGWTFFMTLPAPYVLMVGLLLQWVTGWPLWLAVVIGTLFSMGYVLAGGFRAVVRTDKLQFVLMFGGFALLLAVLVVTRGGTGFLSAGLPPGHLSATGGNPVSVMLAWYLIALWTFVDPGFHQRCDAAASPTVARNGVLVSVGFWLVFDLLTTTCGLYARVLLPDLADPAMAFPLLGHTVLPPVLSGLFLTGLLAIIMSTIDSFTLLSAMAVGHDLMGSVRRWSPVVRIRIGLVLTAALAITVALVVPSVIGIWYLLGSLFVPPLLLPLLAAYLPALRVPPGWITSNLILGFLVPLVWLMAGVLAGSMAQPRFPLGWQPMFPGLAVSVLLFGLGWGQPGRRTRA